MNTHLLKPIGHFKFEEGNRKFLELSNAELASKVKYGKWKPGDEHGYLMLDVWSPLAKSFIYNIAEEDFHPDYDKIEDLHITLLYGIIESKLDPVELLIAAYRLYQNVSPKVSSFDGVDYFRMNENKVDVLHFTIHSPYALHDVFNRFYSTIPNEHRFVHKNTIARMGAIAPGNNPHSTAAYLKMGTGDKYAGMFPIMVPFSQVSLTYTEPKTGNMFSLKI